MLAKSGFCSKCLQNFSGCSFARTRILLQVLPFSDFFEGSFVKMLVARKANAVLACSQRPFVAPLWRRDDYEARFDCDFTNFTIYFRTLL